MTNRGFTGSVGVRAKSVEHRAKSVEHRAKSVEHRAKSVGRRAKSLEYGELERGFRNIVFNQTSFCEIDREFLKAGFPGF